MTVDEKAAAVRSALAYYLEQLRELTWMITEDATEDEISSVIDLSNTPTKELREGHAHVEEALVRWFEANGRPKVRTGDLLWWIGKTQAVEVLDRKAQLAGVLEIIEEETGIGLVDEERESWLMLLDCLIAANGVRQGAFGKLGDENNREERWAKAFRRKFSEQIKVKSAPEGVAG